jgi:hypothetical protein
MTDNEPFDTPDIEDLLAECRQTSTGPEQHWALSATIANFILRGLPGSRVLCGHPRWRTQPADYITPVPNPPLTVFGPDGRFIVSFLHDGTWLNAVGRRNSVSEIIEGSPRTIANMLVEDAGLGERQDLRIHTSRRAHPYQDSALPRMLQPTSTKTWRDDYPYPSPPNWGAETPPSSCLTSPKTRLILAPYEPNSSTYTAGYGSSARWGIESLRVPAMREHLRRNMESIALTQIHPGDCLVTFGRKFASRDGELDFEEEDYRKPLLWHPQEVVHVEPEGQHHLRVWLIVDRDVSNEAVAPADVDFDIRPNQRHPRVLEAGDRAKILEAFNLDVFCPNCGNRGRPIIYGMPGPDEPEYLVMGGCIVSEDQPQYVCSCDHTWRTSKGSFQW